MDLEKMSKGLSLVNQSRTKRKTTTNVNAHFETMMEDQNFRFGKPAYVRGNERINKVIDYDYLRDFLSSNITKQAADNLAYKKKLSYTRDH